MRKYNFSMTKHRVCVCVFCIEESFPKALHFFLKPVHSVPLGLLERLETVERKKGTQGGGHWFDGALP